MLIVFGGLPGVGRTTLSATVAQRPRAVHRRVDAVESAMWEGGIDRDQPIGFASYGVVEAVAAANLHLGATVLADAVNPVEAARSGWREPAAAEGLTHHVIEPMWRAPAMIDLVGSFPAPGQARALGAPRPIESSPRDRSRSLSHDTPDGLRQTP